MAGSIKVAGHTIAEHDITNDRVNIKNATINNTVTINAGDNVSGIGQLIGFSFSNALNTNGNVVTLESSKSYDAILFQYTTTGVYYFNDLAFATTDSSGNVTVGKYTSFASNLVLESVAANQVYIRAYTQSNYGYSRALIFERGSTFDAS